jgi:lipopolysaccharide/colanic/teichoic acid biosynthesis glycosyltransferase
VQASQRKYWKRKRVFDFAASLLLLALSAPLLLLLAVLICLDDPRGGPIFRQTRLGLGGRRFTMYKFRTMAVDAEQQRAELAALNEMDGPVFKIRDDPRVTRIGKFLRRSSLDELPQLFNVLRGDMSIIGPRPPLPCEAAEYTDYQSLRLIVKPGLTCLWQVRTDRNAVSFAEWVEDDMEYILNASLWGDVKLMLKTPFVMLRGEGC